MQKPAPIFVIYSQGVLTFYSREQANAECAVLVAAGIVAYVA